MLHFINDREYIELYHITHKKLADKIETTGLLTSHSQGAMDCVWFCERSKVDWAIKHLAVHHNWREDALVVFSLLLPKDVLSYHGRGCYISYTNIPPILVRRCKYL